MTSPKSKAFKTHKFINNPFIHYVMKKRLFTYYPEDFGALPIKVLQMDLDFEVYNDKTTVVSHLKARTLEKALRTLTLNAKNLEIHEVLCDKYPVTFNYRKKEHLLDISFSKPVPAKTEFVIKTKTTCKPTKNVLEGIYYDESPKGCPPTQITQCQQWGFQRLVPCIDDMTAKCVYTTTITADKKYTNIITNGDPRTERTEKNGKVTVKYDNTKTPMATYLFFLGVGTYATFTREFEYPDGHTFQLELLVHPNSDKNVATRALDVMHDAVLWVYLFTGPDRYKNTKKSKELWELIKQREELKQKGKNPSSIRKKIMTLSSSMNFGYKYTGKIYREIAMQNSDFGGMENVGNTTITANRIMPYPEMTDGSFEYMIQVKVHEFYHNLNGSEVTGWSPFEIWLNEAVTVHVERQYHAFLFGEIYSRLGDALDLISPDGGTLLRDVGAISMPIEPDGFNDPNELITDITYVKAPEFVRMVESLLGKEKFNEGLYLYYKRYKHGNATRAQWVQAMEDVSGINLQNMAKVWLKKIGYPIIKAEKSFNEKKKECTITLTQTNAADDYWEFPFAIALFDIKGKMISEKLVKVNSKIQNIIFATIEDPYFVSYNREHTVYGKVLHEQTVGQKLLQVRKDNDVINKFMAFYHLLDEEKMKLLKNPKSSVSQIIIDLYYELLTNSKLMNEAGSQFMAIFESVEDEKYAHRYQKLYEVRKKILKTIAVKYEKELNKLYKEFASRKVSGSYIEQQAASIKNRSLKNLCLGLLSKLDTPEVHALIKKQLTIAIVASDKVSAFRMYLDSSAPDKLKVLEEYEKEAKNNLVSWETYLYVVGGNDSDDALDTIRRVEKSPSFRVEQSNDQRALYGSFARNKRKSLETAEGRKYLKETLLKLTLINEFTTVRVLQIFGHVDKMEEQYLVPVMSILVDVLNATNQSETPSVYNTICRMILGLPKSRKAYEFEKGKIRGLE